MIGSAIREAKRNVFVIVCIIYKSFLTPRPVYDKFMIHEKGDTCQFGIHHAARSA